MLSLKQRLALRGKAEIDRFLEKLSPKEASALQRDWLFLARPKQLAPEGEWRVWLLLSGRSFGKTRAGSEWILQRVKQGYKSIGLIGETKADCRDVMVEVGESSILRVASPQLRPIYEPSKRRLTWSNGAIATVFSGDEPDQLRGPQFDTAWVDELSKFKYPEETWDNLELALRLGPNPQVLVTTTPRPIGIIRKLIDDPDTVTVKGTSFENQDNLSPRYIKRLLAKYEGTTIGRQEIYAELLSENPGAFWNRTTMLDAFRVKQAPELEKIVIGLDVASTSKKTSDLTGVVVCGKAGKHGYVLEDLSDRYSPDQWAKTAIKALHKYRGNEIIAESNQGGEMIETVIHNVDENVPVRLVHACLGKAIRAEPIVSKVEQGLIHHVGTLDRLEDELCNWVPGQGKSPNRLDALVWGMWALLIDGEKPVLPVYSIELGRTDHSHDMGDWGNESEDGWLPGIPGICDEHGNRI